MNKNQNIEKNGYRFVGWYIDPERRKRINPGGQLPHVVTLYDKWIPILYPVHYICHGGVNSRKNPRRVTVESGAQMLYPATKPKQKFVTWLYEGKPIEILPARICHSIELEALFSDYDVVRFETFGGGQIVAKEVGPSGLLEPFRAPMRMGSEFAGWYWDRDFQLPYDFDQPIHQSCTLYAKWNVIEYAITYDCDGGFAARSNPKKYTYFMDSIPLLPAVKKGYKFLGWYDSREEEVFAIERHSLGNKHFIARFQKL